jgi:circadian clock protein KaiC
VSARSQRIDPTGIAGLDLILGGGLARGALMMVIGSPGSGKTTLAVQMAFAAARSGRRAIILTALSESTNKLIAHLRTLSFFDEALIGEAIQVLSIQQFLEHGLGSAADALVATVRQMRADLVVLDGYQGVRGIDGAAQAGRQFLYDAGGRLNLLGVTLIVTHTGSTSERGMVAEATTADAVLGLSATVSGTRQRRGLTAIKVRGAAPLTGRHALTLDETGVTVYPRLETRVARARPEVAAAGALNQPILAQVERTPFGLPELDVILGGGLTRDSRTLAVGRLGTGKTLLALHFALNGVRAGEKVLFVGFRENPQQLVQKADLFALGAELRAALAPGGGLTLLRFPPVELDPDILADTILDTIERTGARRLIVDSVAEIERAAATSSDPGRLDDYLAALVEALRAGGVTSFFTKELRQTVAAEIDFAEEPIAVFTENVMLLRQVAHRGRVRRVLAVLKMNFSAHDTSLREFTIEPPIGIHVLAPLESDDGVLDELTTGGSAGD